MGWEMITDTNGEGARNAVGGPNAAMIAMTMAIMQISLQAPGFLAA
jgi:hypothetical protein